MVYMCLNVTVIWGGDTSSSHSSEKGLHFAGESNVARKYYEIYPISTGETPQYKDEENNVIVHLHNPYFYSQGWKNIQQDTRKRYPI